jgi:tetratricopeptide (TPR) repeat protein
LTSALSAVVAGHRGRCDVLADGSVVITLLGEGAATDQAARAARCALAIRELVPAAPMALAIGRGVVGDPLGDLIDRATGMVRGPGEVRVDEVTAGLLDVRFSLDGDDHGLMLAGERDVATPARTLLGRPIPCVGRERELAALGALFEECVGEPMAHVVLVTGPPGIGKSRLRYELVQRLADQDAEIWIGRGDPMSAGAPFAMLAQALRRAAGIVDDEPLAVRRWKLTARVSRHVHASEAPRVAEFLAELLGIAHAEPGSVQLRAARGDPQLMGDQMLRACEDFIAAECSANPVVLVLEDLQWGDLPTVQFIDALARRLASSPLLVLALARPDIDAVFPRLWKERGVERIQLSELTRRAAEKLVRTALGDDVDAALVGKLVERAAGNAFYLEELVRSVAEGHGDRLPETVVAMAQARIESLEPEVRHVLRAASIFGQTFWRGGVEALLERKHSTDNEVGAWIDELVRRELVTARRDSRFVGEPEYVFRHALVREAAYAMLPDRDRMVGHRIAGEWLEGRAYFSDGGNAAGSDVEAVVLAEHFLRGNELRRSITWYREAAELALEGDDLAAAIERAERAIACVHAVGDTDNEADSELVGVLRQLQAGAHVWRGEYVLAAERGSEAIVRLEPGTPRWLAAISAVAEASARRLDHDRVIEIGKQLAIVELTAETYRAYAFAVAVTMSSLLWYGDPALPASLFDRLDVLEPAASDDPAVGAWIRVARSWRALREGDQAAAMLLDAAAEDCFTAVGDFRHACMQRANVGYGEMTLGAFARAERSLREALTNATRIGLPHVISQAHHNLGLVLARQGKLDEAREVETSALQDFLAQDNRRLAAAAYNYLALIEIEAGNHAAAIAHAQSAIACAADKSTTLCTYHGTLAHALRLSGQLDVALSTARTAMKMVAHHGPPEEGEAALRLEHAECLHAAGNRDAARIAIADAAQLVADTAAKIKNANWRASFLQDVVEHARILALAAAWS